MGAEMQHDPNPFCLENVTYTNHCILYLLVPRVCVRGGQTQSCNIPSLVPKLPILVCVSEFVWFLYWKVLRICLRVSQRYWHHLKALLECICRLIFQMSHQTHSTPRLLRRLSCVNLEWDDGEAAIGTSTANLLNLKHLQGTPTFQTLCHTRKMAARREIIRYC